MRQRLRGASATLALAVALGGAASSAQARTLAMVSYPIGDVWPTTIRFLRVDQGYPIKEKDEPAGYVLFELAENKRVYRAALELVKTADADGRAATQIVCSIPDLPRRYEATLLDKLSTKVRDERGPPAPPPRKPPVAHEPAPKENRPEPKPETKTEPKSPADISELPHAPTMELPGH
jgi:hypothetical protein